VKRHSFIFSLAALTLLPMLAVAQESEVPKAELALGYSYLNVHPTKSQVTSFNMNGGGVGLVYNLNKLLGIKGDFMGYRGSNTVSGAVNSVTANPTLFTYLFGPQVKFRGHKVDYFAEALFGAGHTSASYSQLLYVNGAPGAVYNSNNSFMMEYGGGLDWKVGHHVSIRPAEVAYLWSRFSTNNISAQQNGFKYFVGVNIGMGSH
jgi:hypothetical protein